MSPIYDILDLKAFIQKPLKAMARDLAVWLPDGMT
jgi:hypothetical protein